MYLQPHARRVVAPLQHLADPNGQFVLILSLPCERSLTCRQLLGNHKVQPENPQDLFQNSRGLTKIWFAVEWNTLVTLLNGEKGYNPDSNRAFKKNTLCLSLETEMGCHSVSFIPSKKLPCAKFAQPLGQLILELSEFSSFRTSCGSGLPFLPVPFLL